MKFYERNEELLTQEKARLDKEAEQMGLNAPLLFARQGITVLRILPPYSEVGAFYHHAYLHHVQIGGDRKVVPCPAAEDLACPICAKGEQMYNTHDEALLKQAKDLRPREYYLYNVLCYSGQPDGRGQLPEFGKVYVLRGGVMIHRQIMALDRDEATGWANITDLENGVNISITRTGTGMLDTKYNVNPCPRSNLLADCQVRSIDINKIELYALDKVYSLLPAEEIEAIAERIQFIPSGPAPVGGQQGVVGVPVPGPAPVPVPAPMPAPVPAVVPAATPPTVAPAPQPVQTTIAPTPTVAAPLPTPVAAYPAPVAAEPAQAPIAAAAPVVEPAPATVPLVAPTAQPATPAVPVEAEAKPEVPVIPPPPPAGE